MNETTKALFDQLHDPERARAHAAELGVMDFAESALSYLRHRHELGSFGMAVLSNDLRGALGRADLVNRGRIFEIVVWLHNNFPAHAWGSRERVDAYLAGPEERTD